MVLFPAVSVDALFVGLDACGLDSRRIRHDLGLAPRYVDPTELLPYKVWNGIWEAARKLDPVQEDGLQRGAGEPVRDSSPFPAP